MLSFILIQSGVPYDFSDHVESITTSGRKGAAGRTISVSLLDAPEFSRAPVSLEDGCRFIFSWDGVEQIRGLMTDTGRGKNKMLKLSGRDNLIYLANNSDTFNYSNVTATYIFKDLCARYGLNVGTVAETDYVIPSLSIEQGTLWDALCDALSRTYKATGVRYYIISFKGAISLIRRRDVAASWVIEEGRNLLDYNLSCSIDEICTRVQMVNDTGSVVASAINTAMEKKLGIFQKIIRADSELNAAQLQELTDSTLKLSGVQKEQLDVTGLGISELQAGGAVRVIIPELSIGRSYYIDEDTHTFKGRYHSMQLTLNKTDEW